MVVSKKNKNLKFLYGKWIKKQSNSFFLVLFGVIFICAYGFKTFSIFNLILILAYIEVCSDLY